MSDFLVNLVRRGAGLPLRTTLRPAVVSESMPYSGASETAALESAPGPLPAHPSSAEPALTERAPRSPEPTITETPRPHFPEPTITEAPPSLLQRSGIPAGVPAPTLSPTTAMSVSQSLTSDVVPAAESPGPDIPTLPLASTTPASQRLKSDLAPAAVSTQLTEPLSSIPRVEATREIQVPPSSVTVTELRTREIRVEPAKAVPGENPPPPLATGGKATVNSTPRDSQGSGPESRQHQPVTEERKIQVRIGRVEIRANPPPPPPRNLPTPSRSGFNEFALARAYLDRLYR